MFPASSQNDPCLEWFWFVGTRVELPCPSDSPHHILCEIIEICASNNNKQTTRIVEGNICPPPFPGPWLTMLAMINSFQEHKRKPFWHSRSLWPWLWPSDPKINTGHLLVMSNLQVKYEEFVINGFQDHMIDRQTDISKTIYLRSWTGA